MTDLWGSLHVRWVSIRTCVVNYLILVHHTNNIELTILLLRRYSYVQYIQHVAGELYVYLASKHFPDVLHFFGPRG